jgi:hypothetical protein
MTTVREYFDTDAKALNAETLWEMNSEGIIFNVLCKLSYKFEEKIKYFSLFFPKESNIHCIMHILNQKEIQTGSIDQNEKIQTVGYSDNPERIKLSEFSYVKNIFIYIDRILSIQEKTQLIEYWKIKGLNLTIRDITYAEDYHRLSKPLAFISHDSRDKDEIVRELAQKLVSLNCPVWYDEYSLKMGDSLREKIEEGIKNAPYCILILSKNFLSNEKWAKSEFETIFIKEIYEKKKIIIPIWHGISEDDLYKYCPKLLDRLGGNSSVGIEQLAKEIAHILKLEQLDFECSSRRKLNLKRSVQQRYVSIQI